jgi:hypothetical protein
MYRLIGKHLFEGLGHMIIEFKSFASWRPRKNLWSRGSPSCGPRTQCSQSCKYSFNAEAPRTGSTDVDVGGQKMTSQFKNK